MASLSTDAKGNRRIQFVNVDGVRKAIRLGSMNKEAAQAFKKNVESLLDAKIANCDWGAKLSGWVRDLPDAYAEKLAAVGLIEKREAKDEATKQQKAEKATVASFIDTYIKFLDGKKKPRTIINLRQAERYLLEYFGKTRKTSDVTNGDADDYRKWLETKVGPNTSRRHLGRAKQFFRAAQRKRLIAENPFGDMKGLSVQANRQREFFVSRLAASSVLAACPNNEWRLLFALARFGGLRTPSEPLSLKWGDIDWERSRFRVTSVKTAHHGEGHEERWVPIFPELQPYLDKAWEEAKPKAEYVIARYRSTNTNLRTHLMRIIQKAGLTAWPKLFQNLRSTRETELAEQFPIHVVCSWLGNSPAVAHKHYLQTTEEHFSKAAQIQAQHAVEIVPQDNAPKPGVLPSADYAATCRSVQSFQCPPQDLNLKPAD